MAVVAYAGPSTRVEPKDPDATVDYKIDWSGYLADAGDDAITVSEWSVPPALTLVSDSHDAMSATVWVSGGTAGERVKITHRIITAAGRTDERSFVVPVMDR